MTVSVGKALRKQARAKKLVPKASNPKAVYPSKAQVSAHYEGAQKSRFRKAHHTQTNPNQLTDRSAEAMREEARFLERNHDLVEGIIRPFVNNVVGANGIGIEPQPIGADGEIDVKFAKVLSDGFEAWGHRPEVTRTHSWPQSQRIGCRSWVRDGEFFTQLISGSVAGLRHGSTVPFSLELFESDLVPFSENNDNTRQGIQLNSWGQPTHYLVQKTNLADMGLFSLKQEYKRVPADNILHVKSVNRIGQLRGVTFLASILTRLADLKDYEESERVAAKVAAALTAYVKRGNAENYDGPETDENGNPIPRDIALQPGTIIDTLAIGEEIGLIDSSRPNVNTVTWRDGQLGAIASGVGGSKSTITRNYDGSFSSQRQELVEQWVNYMVLTDEFTTQYVKPVYLRYVQTAVMSGRITLPQGMTLQGAVKCLFVGQNMPWIDPVKEALAWERLVQAGFASEVEVIRKRGGKPDELLAAMQRFRDKARDKELVLTSDGANTQRVPDQQLALFTNND